MGICISNANSHPNAIIPASFLLKQDEKQTSPSETRDSDEEKRQDRLEKLYQIALPNPHAITVINLSLSSLGVSGCLHLAKLLPLCPNITVMKLWKCRIGAKGAEILSEPLQGLLKLQVLAIEENDLGIEGAEHIGHSLTYLDNLRELHCHSNDLQCEGVKYIADGLSILHNLTVLMIDDNDITSFGLKYVLENVRLGKIESLGLSNDRITDCGASALIRHAPKLAKLKLLKISGNLVNTHQRQALYKTFTSANIC